MTALAKPAAPGAATVDDRPTRGRRIAVRVIVIAWGPIPATQKALPVLVMIGVVIIGVEALRRQTAREFPPAAATGDEHASVLGA